MKVTKHAIDEYINDNPKCSRVNAELAILKEYNTATGYVRRRLAKSWTNFEFKEPRTIIKYYNKWIVFTKTHIITYYLMFHRSIINYQYNRRKKVNKLINLTL